MDGWIDGWMDGWMDDGRAAQYLQIQYHSILHAIIAI